MFVCMIVGLCVCAYVCFVCMNVRVYASPDADASVAYREEGEWGGHAPKRTRILCGSVAARRRASSHIAAFRMRLIEKHTVEKRIGEYPYMYIERYSERHIDIYIYGGGEKTCAGICGARSHPGF